jgi:hypothetical protein
MTGEFLFFKDKAANKVKIPSSENQPLLKKH